MSDSDLHPIFRGGQGRSDSDIEKGVFAWGFSLITIAIVIVVIVMIRNYLHGTP